MNKKLILIIAVIILLVVPSYGHDKEQGVQPLQDIPSLYKDGHYEEVVNLLKNNKISDEQSVIYLGLSHLKLKNLDQTISVWKEYVKVAPGGETARRLSQYLTPLLMESAKEGARKARQTEQSLITGNLDPNVIAVAPFENKGSSEYDALSTGFAEMVISDLSQVKTLKVVERMKIQALINELKLSESGLVDLNSAPQIGKLLGAGKMASGSFANTEKEKLRINLSMVQTQEGQILSEKESFGTLQEFYKLEKSLVVQVLCGMGRCPESLDEQTRVAINKIHTTNFQAFLQFSRGLALRDQGKYREARQAFLQALVLDPQFRLSQEKLLETPLFPITQAVVFSEEKNAARYETSMEEIPLDKPSNSADEKSNEDVGKGEKDEREKPSSFSSETSKGNADSYGEIPMILPVPPPPPAVLVPIQIKLQF